MISMKRYVCLCNFQGHFDTNSVCKQCFLFHVSLPLDYHHCKTVSRLIMDCGLGVAFIKDGLLGFQTSCHGYVHHVAD